MVSKYATKKTVYIFKEAKHLHTNNFCLAAEYYSVSENTEKKSLCFFFFKIDRRMFTFTKYPCMCDTLSHEHSVTGRVKLFLFLSINILHMHLLFV